MFRYHLFLLLCLAAVSLAAQETPPLATTGQEVIVTGARYARPATESPVRVTVIDSARVAQAADLGQLLGEQAGIVVNGAYSNPGKDRSLFLRNGANQFTLLLIDGQPLLDPSSLGGAVDLRLLSLDGIERIEILRGARSLLYGSDAVAGVINLITRRDTVPDPFTLHLRAAAQSYGTVEAGVAISGSSPTLDYRLGYDRFSTDGISEAAAPAGAVDFAADGATRETFAAALTYRPHANLSIRPALRRARFDGDYDAGAFRDAANTYRNDLWLPSLAVHYAKGKTAVGLRSNYAATDRIFTDATFGTSEFRGRMDQEDLFATYHPTPRAALTAGTQRRHERLLGAEGDLTATTLSPYLQLNLTVAEKLLLEAGYRFNHHSAFGGQSNWSLALGGQSTERWSTRLSLGSAFQSPTPDQLGGPFGANPELSPQVATSVSLNTQLVAADGAGSISLTGFRRHVRDLITYDFTSGYRNQDELLDHGLELEATTRLHPTLSLSGNLTHVRGKLTQPDGNGGSTETRDFFRRPRTYGVAHLRFTPRKRPFLLRLSVHYTGERPDVWFDADFTRTETTLDPYLLVNAYGEYRLLRSERLKLFFDLRNVTDTDFTEVTGFSTQGVTARVGGGVAW